MMEEVKTRDQVAQDAIVLAQAVGADLVQIRMIAETGNRSSSIAQLANILLLVSGAVMKSNLEMPSVDRHTGTLLKVAKNLDMDKKIADLSAELDSALVEDEAGTISIKLNADGQGLQNTAELQEDMANWRLIKKYVDAYKQLKKDIQPHLQEAFNVNDIESQPPNDEVGSPTIYSIENYRDR